MATTFNVIFLGVSATDIDPIEGNATSEDVGALVGTTFGAPSNPLYDSVETLSPVGDPGGTYESGDDPDQFSVSGTTYRFDGWGVYAATVTYADGTTATVVAKIAQSSTGELFLVPDTDPANQALFEAKPINSLTLDALGTQDSGMEADRPAGDFIEVVDGTAGADTIGFGYVDADGDTVTEGADVVRGGVGNDTIDAGGGDDVIDAGGGDDTISGGEGHDTIYADEGNDTVYGGAGNDVIEDWDGNDIVHAGEGNDVAQVSVGNDTFYMDGGDDLVNVWDNAGINALYGGVGHDTLDFLNWQSTSGATVTFNADGSGSFSHYSGATTGTFDGFEVVTGTVHGDTLDGSNATVGLALAGEGGDDLLIGGAGDDVLGGDAGNDSLTGGAGSDTLGGGFGDDTLRGGAGDDVVTTGGGADTVVVDTAGGRDVVTDFDMTLAGGRTYDQLDVSNLTNGSGGPVTWKDVVVTDTIGDGTGDAVLTFPGGESLVLQGVSPGQVDGMHELLAIGIPCFAAGTPILTPAGPRAVETLKRDDLVLTHVGPLPVVWAGSRHLGQADLAAKPETRPIHFNVGVIGNSLPLRLSPQHNVLLAGTDGSPVLVRARHMAEAGLRGVRVAQGVRSVVYHHLLLPRHAILRAGGALVESMYPGKIALAAFPPAARLEVAAAVVGLRGRPEAGVIDISDLAALYGPRAYPLLGRKEALHLCRNAFALPAFGTVLPNALAAS